MNIKSTISIVFCILIGFMMSNFMFKQYDSLKAFNTNRLYFLQIGSYSTKEDMEKANMNSSQYIVEENNGIYYAYISVTSNQDNFNKLKDYFSKQKYTITLKEKTISNNQFSDILEKYDLLLKETDDEDTIKLINNQIINKYKEFVVNG